jgi:predicted nucleic acid-binding protein
LASRPLQDLPDGTDVFVDANIFIYAFGEKSAQCTDLLVRCAQERVFGITSFDIVNEVTHRLMLLEAVGVGLIQKERAEDLKRHVNRIPLLTGYWILASKIFALNVLLLQTDESRLRQAHAVRASAGLLTNDSLIVAAMNEFGIPALATRDDDFDHLPNLVVYKPTDLP